MNEKKPTRRWPIALGVVLIVVLISSMLIYSFHDAPGNRMPVDAISDGAGGAIVAWHDAKGIHAQRIDSSGHITWPAGGVTLNSQPHFNGMNLQSDGLGGAIIAWAEHDDSEDPYFHNPMAIHTQRISATGTLLWENTLIATGDKWQIIPDGTGGALFAFDSFETFYKSLRDNYLRIQKIAPDGRRLWGDDGVLVVASAPFRDITPEELANGVQGTAVRSFPTYAGHHYVVSDGAGGIVAIWDEDTLTGMPDQIYAQTIDNNGDPVWTDRVSIPASRLISAESDGAGGAVIWIGYANQTPLNSGSLQSGKIFAHVTGSGELLPQSVWPPNIATQVDDGLGGSFHIRADDHTIRPPDYKVNYFIQRFDASEQPYYAEQVLISEDLPFRNVEYIPDGAGGLAVVIGSLRSNQTSLPAEILVFKMAGDGSTAWGGQGTPVLDLPGTKYRDMVTAMGDGSSVIVLGVLGKGALAGDMIYLQKIDTSGNALWGEGVRIND